eukprot:6487762-Amphidinium_carterae.3
MRWWGGRTGNVVVLLSTLVENLTQSLDRFTMLSSNDLIIAAGDFSAAKILKMSRAQMSAAVTTFLDYGVTFGPKWQAAYMQAWSKDEACTLEEWGNVWNVTASGRPWTPEKPRIGDSEISESQQASVITEAVVTEKFLVLVNAGKDGRTQLLEFLKEAQKVTSAQLNQKPVLDETLRELHEIVMCLEVLAGELAPTQENIEKVELVVKAKQGNRFLVTQALRMQLWCKQAEIKLFKAAVAAATVLPEMERHLTTLAAAANLPEKLEQIMVISRRLPIFLDAMEAASLEPLLSAMSSCLKAQLDHSAEHWAEDDPILVEVTKCFSALASQITLALPDMEFYKSGLEKCKQMQSDIKIAGAKTMIRKFFVDFTKSEAEELCSRVCKKQTK